MLAPGCTTGAPGACAPGRAAIPAYAEDYAALLEALLTLAEVDDLAWLDDARTVADDLVRLFADDEHGGFFTTGTDAEPLIVRPKDYQDNATPSENSLAASALLRLAALTGDDADAARATRWVRALTRVAGEHPTAFAYLLGAVERVVGPSLEVVIVGDPDDPVTAQLVAEVHGRVLPASVVVIAAPGSDETRTPLLAGRTGVTRPTAYVCRDFVCDLPVTDPDALRAQLDAALT